MIEGRLSRRYARALFQLALEEHREEELGQEIERSVSVYADSPLMGVLNNPAFSLNSRKNVMVEVAKSLELSPLMTHFISLLLERDRLTFLSSIAFRYRRMLDERQGRVEAGVVAAAPLESEVVEGLREALRRISGKQVLLKEETDPGLIGGVVIQMEGKIYDGSVRTQLEKMRERMERGY